MKQNIITHQEVDVMAGEDMHVKIIQQEEDVMAGEDMHIKIIHQQEDVMTGEDMRIVMEVGHTIMKQCLECKV
eukprot:11523259-Ditylum_brightwellii.AAC.1